MAASVKQLADLVVFAMAPSVLCGDVKAEERCKVKLGARCTEGVSGVFHWEGGPSKARGPVTQKGHSFSRGKGFGRNNIKADSSCL